MASIGQYRVARKALEASIATLISRARSYPGDEANWRTQELLSAAREYGRALNRVEHMRGRNGG